MSAQPDRHPDDVVEAGAGRLQRLGDALHDGLRLDRDIAGDDRAVTVQRYLTGQEQHVTSLHGAGKWKGQCAWMALDAGHGDPRSNDGESRGAGCAVGRRCGKPAIRRRPSIRTAAAAAAAAATAQRCALRKRPGLRETAVPAAMLPPAAPRPVRSGCRSRPVPPPRRNAVRPRPGPPPGRRRRRRTAIRPIHAGACVSAGSTLPRYGRCRSPHRFPRPARHADRPDRHWPANRAAGRRRV